LLTITPSASPTDGEKKQQTGYQKFCKVRCISLITVPFLIVAQENRERIKLEFPDLKGKEITEKVRLHSLLLL
jgi:hypothetical protein